MRAARDKAIDLLAQAPELRVSLLPFAARAVLRCPLTSDHLAVARMLEDCTPELFPARAGLQGTAIGQAVETGLDILARDAGRGQAILVISDGVDPEAESVRKAGALSGGRAGQPGRFDPRHTPGEPRAADLPQRRGDHRQRENRAPVLRRRPFREFELRHRHGQAFGKRKDEQADEGERQGSREAEHEAETGSERSLDTRTFAGSL